jgi:hypothetical protein
MELRVNRWVPFASIYHLLDLTVYGRQEEHEESPDGWPKAYAAGELTLDGRPVSQWSRVEAGRPDDLGNGNYGEVLQGD